MTFEQHKNFYIYKNLIIKKAINGVKKDTDKKSYLVNIEQEDGSFKRGIFRDLIEALEFFYKEFTKLPWSKNFIVPEQLRLF